MRLLYILYFVLCFSNYNYGFYLNQWHSQYPRKILRKNLPLSELQSSLKNELISPQIPKIHLGFFRSNKIFCSVIEHNWEFGVCSHRNVFEGSDDVQNIRFFEDYLAFGFQNGRCCLLKISTGEIVDKFNLHNLGISALDFDGNSLVSAGHDGNIHVYNLTYASSREFGTSIFTYDIHNNEPVTAIKLGKLSPFSHKNDLLISAGLDRQLYGINVTSGQILYTTVLPVIPLCIDIKDNYIAVGCIDGRMQIYNAKNGKLLIEFTAHLTSVNTVCFQNKDIIYTGGQDGTIRRWDISGRFPELPRAQTILDVIFHDAIYSTASLFPKEKFLSKLPPGAVEIIKTSHSSPVVALQCDSHKIVTGHQNGEIIIFDAITGLQYFHIAGRSEGVMTLQYDKDRLFADGTYNVIVMHDFNADVNSTVTSGSKIYEDCCDGMGDILRINMYKNEIS